MVTIFPLKDSSTSFVFISSSFLSGDMIFGRMNKRFIMVGALLGFAITVAFFVGSPMFGGFDMNR